MPVQTMQSVAEHQLFKAALPIVTAALIGSITWLFVTVLDVEKEIHKIEYSDIPQINTDVDKHSSEIEKLEDLIIDMRIKMTQLQTQVDAGLRELRRTRGPHPKNNFEGESFEN